MKNGVGFNFSVMQNEDIVLEENKLLHEAHEGKGNNCKMFFQLNMTYSLTQRKSWQKRLNHAPENVLQPSFGILLPSELRDIFNFKTCRVCSQGNMERGKRQEAS